MSTQTDTPHAFRARTDGFHVCEQRDCGRIRNHSIHAGHYRTDVPAIDAARVTPAANSFLCSVDLVVNARHVPSAQRAERIVQLADEYAAGKAGTPGSWPNELRGLEFV